MNSGTAATVTVPLVQFLAAGRRCAVDLPRVERVVRMVALTPLPDAPRIVLGVFDLHGEVVPVASVAMRLGAPAVPPRATDQLLIVRTPRRRIALAVEHVVGLVQVPETEISWSMHLGAGPELTRGVATLRDGDLLMIHDLDAFLSLQDEADLERAMNHRR